MSKQNKIKVFKTVEELAEYICVLLQTKSGNIPEGKFMSVALSGGSTPKKLFNYISSQEATDINWKKIKLFWGDERCVPPDNDESNYEMTKQNLLTNIDIPIENIFRILGENEPEKEAIRYARILGENLEKANGFPKFDIVFLGLGDDGHTASIFSGNTSLFNATNFCEAVKHPKSNQSRITIIGPVINNADVVIFLVTSKSKANIVAQLLNNDEEMELPASLVNPASGNLFWLLDTDAAELLDNK
ncbi:MAG: 6-phosphogluconolactonase [Saprospiraceae bacterium]